MSQKIDGIIGIFDKGTITDPRQTNTRHDKSRQTNTRHDKP